MVYDELVLEQFVKNQLQLFPEKVAETTKQQNFLKNVWLLWLTLQKKLHYILKKAVLI